jgi:hypothetical protein
MSVSLRKIGVLSLAVVSVVVPAMAAGQALISSNAPGTWLPERVTNLDSTLGKEDERALVQKLQRMTRFVGQTKQLAAPRGVSAHPGIYINQRSGEPGSRNVPAIADARVLLLPIHIESSETKFDEARGVYIGGGEGPSLVFSINDVAVAVGDTRPFGSSGPAIFSAPNRVGETQGYPTYEIKGRNVTLITRGRRPLWRAASQAQVIQGLIAMELDIDNVAAEAASGQSDVLKTQLKEFQSQKQQQINDWDEIAPVIYPDPKRRATERAAFKAILDETERTIRTAASTASPTNVPSPMSSRRIAALNGELAKLPTEERSRPACLGNRSTRPSGLGHCREPGATPLVELVPDLFDASKPRTAVQFIATYITRGSHERPSDEPESRDPLTQAHAAFRQLDLAQIEALID